MSVDAVEHSVHTERSHAHGARVLLGMIRLYQGLRGDRISPCRYVPSCSHYALEAVERHGAWRGAWLAVRRVARCNPFGRYGFDPVPD